MSYITHPVRPGLTAIAAVLALSATPSFAQAADPAAAPLVTPPPVVSAPTVTAPAATTAPTPAPAVQSAGPASGGLVTVPIRPGPMSIQPRPAPAPIVETTEPAPAPVARSAPRNGTSVSRTAAATSPRATTAPVEAPAPVATPAPVAAGPAPAPVVAPAPVAKAPAPVAPAGKNDDILPIAGAAGAAILLLGGGLYAMNRRRREPDELYDVDTVETPIETFETPVAPMVQPAVYAAPVAASRPLADPHGFAGSDDAPFNTLPAGFDTSRFGRHTQAAYRGPTPENPFLSLKRRLKRASFFDMRERMAAEGGQAFVADPIAARAPQPAAAPRQTEYVTTRLQRPANPGFRPAYSN